MRLQGSSASRLRGGKWQAGGASGTTRCRELDPRGVGVRRSHSSRGRIPSGPYEIPKWGFRFFSHAEREMVRVAQCLWGRFAPHPWKRSRLPAVTEVALNQLRLRGKRRTLSSLRGSVNPMNHRDGLRRIQPSPSSSRFFNELMSLNGGLHGVESLWGQS
jgi:hypothetical protein